MVEDEAFIGSRCMVVGGARVAPRARRSGAGAILTPTTHVIDVETGEELPRGEVPAWSVCVGGTRSRKFPGGEFGMPCLLVLKRLPEGSRHDKATLNEILRDHGVTASEGSASPNPPDRPRRWRATYAAPAYYLGDTMNVNSEPHRRVRRQGPATLRGKQIPGDHHRSAAARPARPGRLGAHRSVAGAADPGRVRGGVRPAGRARTRGVDLRLGPDPARRPEYKTAERIAAGLAGRATR